MKPRAKWHGSLGSLIMGILIFAYVSSLVALVFFGIAHLVLAAQLAAAQGAVTPFLFKGLTAVGVMAGCGVVILGFAFLMSKLDDKPVTLSIPWKAEHNPLPEAKISSDKA